MKLNTDDMAIIEQALREVINQGADYHKVSMYQSVLGKLQEMHLDDPFSTAIVSSSLDGFRYDYDA